MRAVIVSSERIATEIEVIEWRIDPSGALIVVEEDETQSTLVLADGEWIAFKVQGKNDE